MEKAIFIFHYPSVLISLKKAASGADNPKWFTRGDGNLSLSQKVRIYFSIVGIFTSSLKLQ